MLHTTGGRCGTAEDMGSGTPKAPWPVYSSNNASGAWPDARYRTTSIQQSCSTLKKHGSTPEVSIWGFP